MSRYSLATLARHAWRSNAHWPEALPERPLKPSYDAVIVGAGGHGLAAAWYLASQHGMTNIAVVDKGWLGGGNVARNTTIVRSNYFHPARRAMTNRALELWRGLSQELNYNVMFSPRGIINLAHSSSQMDDLARRGNAMMVDGVGAELLSVEDIRRRVPILDTDPQARHPIVGGMVQHEAGTARHDAVAWGYARAAMALGVDIFQNCEVTGIETRDGRIESVNTRLGRIATPRLALCAAGGTSHLARMVGLTMPLENHLLQACVTEPVKPVLDCILTHGVHNFYISQTDKGELVLGGDIDGYNNATSVGDPRTFEEIARVCLSLFPGFEQLRVMRTWGGVVDMSMDGSPILSQTPIDGLYVNAGWCYGGFKATPAAGEVLAEMIATDTTPSLAAEFGLDRFTTGAVVSEEGHGPRPWMYH